jgi:hypothetical protein
MSTPHRVAAICALAAAAIVAVHTGSTELRAQALAPRAVPRIAGTSFLMARYKAGASFSLYAAQRLGAGMVLAGVVGNPETGYRAVILGGGTHVRLGRRDGVTVLLGGAQASDGTFLRLYVLPKFATGRMLAKATGTFKQPLGGKGLRDAAVDPLTVSLRVSAVLRVGLSGVLSVAERRPVDWGMGPSANVRVPGGSVALEIISRAGLHRLEVRGAFSASL